MTNPPNLFPRTRIKVCGIRDADSAVVAAEAGADAIGFVFVPGTPRYITTERAAGIMYALPPFVTAVGVVRDLSVDDFVELEQSCPTPLFQLHGDETEDTCRHCGPGVVKAIGYHAETMVSDLVRWSLVDEVDALLIDNPVPGSGEPIEWGRLREAIDIAGERLTKPLILAGGLNPGNVAEAVRIVRPYGVDVSSGVESSRGVKDPARIAEFCAAVRSATLL